MLSFYPWSRSSKNDKLETLKQTCTDLDESLRIIRQRHDRLMAHLGLVEIDGPRIVKSGSLEAGIIE